MKRSLASRGALALALFHLSWTSACDMSARDENRDVSDRHLLLLVERERSGFRIDQVHVVASPLPATRAPRSLRWRVAIEDGSGRALFSESIPQSGIRRGAFANDDGTTQSVETRRESFTFAVRVPLVREA